MSDVVVLGAGGLLGRHLLARLGARARGYDHAACDITDAQATRRAIADARVVINCAAWTDVDGNERDPARAMAVNGDAVEHLAASAHAEGARLLHLSTDFVFDGEAEHPYAVDDVPAPLSIYGHAKHAGERFTRAFPEHTVVRVQALYGAGGQSFSSRLPDLLVSGEPLRLDRQRRVQPTWAMTAARAIVRLVDEGGLGPIVHVSARGETTWAAFAERLAARLGVVANMRAVDSDTLDLAARRPRMCLFADDPRLDMPRWADDLDAFVAAGGAHVIGGAA